MTIATVEPVRGVSLVAWGTEAEAAAGIARAVVGTAFVPVSLRVMDENHNLDFDATIATVTATLLTGQELGFGPMAALRAIVIIPPGSGNPAMLAAALRGLLLYHGHDIWVAESTASRAVVRGCRAGTDRVQESVWTTDRAKRAVPRNFNDPKSNWQRDPASQLVARATAEVSRWVAGDAIMGLPYIAEEFEDGAVDDAAPGDGDNEPASTSTGQATAPRRPAAARRASAPRRRSDRPVRAVPSAAPPSSDGPAEAEPPAAEPMTASQRGAFWAGLKKLGLTDKDEALAAVSGWVGRTITSSNELSKADAGVALTAIGAEEVRRAARAAAEDAQAAQESSQEGPPDGDEPVA